MLEEPATRNHEPVKLLLRIYTLAKKHNTPPITSTHTPLHGSPPLPAPRPSSVQEDFCSWPLSLKLPPYPSRHPETIPYVRTCIADSSSTSFSLVLLELPYTSLALPRACIKLQSSTTYRSDKTVKTLPGVCLIPMVLR